MTDIFNLQELARRADVKYWTLYYWATGRYKNTRMDRQKKMQLANAILDSIRPFLNMLGYEVSVKALKKS